MHKKLKSVEALDSSYLKLQRASKQIAKLHRQMHPFFEDDSNYTVSSYYDSRIGEYLIYCKLSQPLPTYWQILTGEICYNLRSSLDHMIIALAAKNTGVNKWMLYFPIAKDREAFRVLINKRYKHPVTEQLISFKEVIGERAFRKIIAMQPYRVTEQGQGRGNDSLFCLNTLRNYDGHNFLIPTHGSANRLVYSVGSEKWEVAITGPPARPEAGIYLGKSGDLGISVDSNGRLKPKPQIISGGGIGFADIDPLKGRNLIPTLKSMARETAGVFRELHEIFA